VVARTAGAVAGVLLAWAAIDRLRPLGRWPLLLSGAMVAAIVAVAAWWVQKRAHAHPPVDRMARLIEEQCPELEATLRAHGVHNYSIFLLPQTRQLFAYAEIEDEAQWAAIAQTEVCQRWWRHMGDVMPSNPDHSPVAADLREVFHID